jgi:hypothetical protein
MAAACRPQAVSRFLTQSKGEYIVCDVSGAAWQQGRRQSWFVTLRESDAYTPQKQQESALHKEVLARVEQIVFVQCDQAGVGL